VNGALRIERTNTILYCEGFAETVEFYRDVFGFNVTFANDWFTEFVLGDGSHLSVADAARATIGPARGVGITLSWQVLDLEAAYQSLVTRGAQPDPIHQRWGAAAFHVRDPEGHRIELWAPR
jgi:uncharacterized glyoxalase superfamily protein PhnB